MRRLIALGCLVFVSFHAMFAGKTLKEYKRLYGLMEQVTTKPAFDISQNTNECGMQQQKIVPRDHANVDLRQLIVDHKHAWDELEKRAQDLIRVNAFFIGCFMGVMFGAFKPPIHAVFPVIMTTFCLTLYQNYLIGPYYFFSDTWNRIDDYRHLIRGKGRLISGLLIGAFGYCAARYATDNTVYYARALGELFVACGIL